ncbi:MAG: hypothetical protein M1541_02870, partial [Acidobacteria bacterium]|nr:hypothetical protein [Acidobacteriota bacterium]
TKREITNRRPEPRESHLGVEFTDEDFGGSQPLQNLRDLAWQDGGFYLKGSLFAVTDPALQFEEVITTGNRRRFRAPIRLAASAANTYTFASLYRGVAPARISDIRALGFDTALEKNQQFWARLQSQGASITVPDALLNNLFRTFLPRVTINSDLDLNGFSVLQTGPIVYNRIWHHVTSYAVADYLSRRGYFVLAKRYLEPYFQWQGIPA